jgi:hydroxylamine dehydrogenase
MEDYVVSFRSVFIAVVIGFGLVIGAFLIARARPAGETSQPSAAFVKATGKCAECHKRMHYSVVHEHEMSVHAAQNVNCLNCHEPVKGQESQEHHGFTISRGVTAANCKNCHPQVYDQFLRSRHAAPSWAAVYGRKGLPREHLEFAEKYHPGYADRDPNPIGVLEGPSAQTSGCASCHGIGKPNPDGTIGTCTACHTRHTSSVAVARLPSTCGQCHMGPDHSQIEIYEESKHGVLFRAQHRLLKLDTSPARLTTKEMFIPTCTTCHMSGINGLKVTHDTSERLSYSLADPITKKRHNYLTAQVGMKEVCTQCHTGPVIDRVYQQAEKVVEVTNEKVARARGVVDALRKEGLLPEKPFSHPIDFKYFDLWHYYGRTAKHGAFMGGADFIQWHGNYPMLTHQLEIDALAKELRREHGQPKK